MSVLILMNLIYKHDYTVIFTVPCIRYFSDSSITWPSLNHKTVGLRRLPEVQDISMLEPQGNFQTESLPLSRRSADKGAEIDINCT